MVNIRSLNEIIAGLQDFFRLAQPNLSTVPGSVARDLFIEGPASQLALIYDELQAVSNKQSVRLSIGTDLDKIAKNFGLVRKQSTPSTGVALMTFSSLNSVININQGSPVYTGGGLGFTTTAGTSLTPSNINFYRSVASKFQAQLSYVGITDQYAVEATVTASAPGSAGNIGQYSLSQVSIGGINNVTNVVAFAGGTDQETDAAFRSRVLATFSGSSVGTTLGYLNAALSVTGVQSVNIIGPGNPLMTRDGSVSQLVNGVLTVVSGGSGGKVDVVVLGTNDVANTDTYIYQDLSNGGGPTNPKNNFVLGQIAGESGLTISQKRITDIQNGVLPSQPVDALLQVTGTTSGSNFIPYTVDGYGHGTGNYLLVKDTGVYGGSPWGFDTFEWKNNQVVFQEDLIKGQNNGQDSTTFSNVLQITDAQQNLSVTNENSTVTTDRSIIRLLHTPANNVTRVFNTNTGERYLIINQNYDATTPYNNTGRIQISGNTLPSPSDILQVDYTWIVDFDRYSDFDGLIDTENPRKVSNSVDWGYPSSITNELVEFVAVDGDNFFVGSTTHPIDTIISTSAFLQVDGYVQAASSGAFINRLSVIISNLSVPSTTVDSVCWKNTNAELYDTAQANGTFNNMAVVVGIQIRYTTTIVLPSDTVAQIGDRVSAFINTTNVFQSATNQGSSSGTRITLPASLVGTTADRLNLRVSYIANVSNLYSSAITSLPTSRIGNGYILSSNNGFNNFSLANTSRRENQLIRKNLSNQCFIELDLVATDDTLTPDQVISVVRLSDGLQLWNADNEGTIITGTDGNYQLLLSGYNSPQVNSSVMAIYYADDIMRFQPFSFANQEIRQRIDQLAYDEITNSFVVPLVVFTAQSSGLSFEIVDQNADVVYFSTPADGYLTPITPTTATLNSLSVNFSSLPDLTNKRVKITGATTPNNDGYFEIADYDVVSNNITITTTLNNITADQIMVVRILDGQELWNYSGTIDVSNNRLLIPHTTNAVINDKVFTLFFGISDLRKAPTRIIGTTLDQAVNTGIISVVGTTMNLVSAVIFTATSAGLHQNLISTMQCILGIGSGNVPSNVKLAKLVSLQKVSTYAPGSSVVLETLANYDVKNTSIANSLYYSNTMLSDLSLPTPIEFILPSTANNTSTANAIKLGDRLQATFYYTTDGITENLSYTKIGTLYTNNKFALINQMYVSSGFGSSLSTQFAGSSFTKPSLGSRYTAFYDYTAPVQNERILLQYNFNQLIATTTFTIETARPVNADVLVRAAKVVDVDLTMNVVIDPAFLTTQTTVLQNLRNQLISALTSTTLGNTIDQISLINLAQGVQGIDRARCLYFNITGIVGTVLSLTANQDQYFAPNNIVINTESI